MTTADATIHTLTAAQSDKLMTILGEISSTFTTMKNFAQYLPVEGTIGGGLSNEIDWELTYKSLAETGNKFADDALAIVGETDEVTS